MPWKRDDQGQLALDDNGDPIRIDSNGNEASVKDDGIDSLQRAVSESIQRKEKIQDLEKQLKNYEGIDDPQKAKDALEKVQNLENKDLIDAGKAEEMKQQIKDQYENKISEKDQALSERDQQIHNLVVSNAFASSQVVNEKTILPPDVAEAYFGKHFKVENGQAVAYDQNGNPIYSKDKPGEPASFDEALDHLVENHPQRDRLLKGSPGGSGSGPGGGSGGGKKISRSQFDSMEADQAHQFVREGGQVVD